MKFETIKVGPDVQIGLFNLNQLTLSGRIREKKGTDLVLRHLLPNEDILLEYDEFGKPFLKGRTEKISISHSKNTIAVIIDSFKNTGIDIEELSDRVVKVKEKFLSIGELSEVKDNCLNKYMVYWCAKETLYKIHGKKNIDFKNELIILPFDYQESGGFVKGIVKSAKTSTVYPLNYQLFDNNMLVYLA